MPVGPGGAGVVVSVQDTAAPHCATPVLREAEIQAAVSGSADDLATTRTLPGGGVGGRLRVQGVLGPLPVRSRTPPPEGGRTRLVFWPHAGPTSRRGSLLEYEVTRRSHDSLTARNYASRDSLSEFDTSLTLPNREYSMECVGVGGRE